MLHCLLSSCSILIFQYCLSRDQTFWIAESPYKSLCGVLDCEHFPLLLLPMSLQSLLAPSPCCGHASIQLSSLILTGLVSNGSSGHSSRSPAFSAPYTGHSVNPTASTVSSDGLKEYIVSGDSDSLELSSTSVAL